MRDSGRGEKGIEILH